MTTATEKRQSGSWIGTDESGKGDYFGPLVVAAVCVESDSARVLLEHGVRDCKRLSDARVQRLSDVIIENCPHALVVIGPQRYNQLYRSVGNLNKLLAWAHARAIEDLLADVTATRAVVDKFADDAVLRRALMQRGSSIEVVQQVRAEEDPAVAAASVLARARFVSALDDLSEQWRCRLRAGAGAPTVEAARSFVALHGAERLEQVAKLHFRTTATVTGTGGKSQRRSR